MGGVRGDDQPDDAAGIRRAYGHDVAGTYRLDAVQDGTDDEGDGKGSGRLIVNEARISDSLPAASSDDASEGHADHVEPGGG